MQITKIKRTVTFGNYENISMEGEILKGQTIDEAVDFLESEIKKQISRKTENDTLKYDVDTLKYKKEQLERTVKDLEKRRALVNAWAEKHNMPVEVISDYPF